MKNRLLARQLSSLGLSEGQLPGDIKAWQALLVRIERAYAEAEQERYLLERSLLISSKEMQERWQTIETERSRAMQSGKMAALGEMAGGVAHEINNPLAVIQLLASQSQEIIAEEPVNHALVLEQLKKIESTSSRIAKIVHGLRTFSRDGTTDPFIATSLKSIVDDTLSLCAARFKDQNIEMRLKPIDESIRLDCRASQLSQVLLNLLNNAHDAIAARPVRWIEIAGIEKEGNVELSVTDCGEGISAEVSEKIFQPFFTTKDPGKGTGLGLSLSKGILDAHGGTISVDQSCPNTRFVITIPKRHAGKDALKKAA